MTMKEIKNRMLEWRDFFGGDIMYSDKIKKAKTKKELAHIMDRYINHLEDVSIDSISHADNFKRELGLHLI